MSAISSITNLSYEDVMSAREFSASLTKFATSLYQTVGKELGPTENVFISPFSIAASLSMVHAGARGNTASQMKNSLHFNDFTEDKINSVMGKLVRSIKGDDNFTLESANQLYVQRDYQLMEQFQSEMEQHFDAPAQSVDFRDFAVEETRAKINKWVEDFTHDKTKEILPQGSLDPLTRLVLVNAIYFKGMWARKFNAKKTKVEPFHLGSLDKKTDVEMMHNYGEFRVGPVESLDARVLQLNYVGHKLSMFIVLPNAIDGLPALESKLPTIQIDTFMDDVMSRMIVTAELEVAIPKFKMEPDVMKMKDVLEGLGMVDMFYDSKADFSGISGNNELFVANVYHRGFVEVNEEGTEAAAVMSLRSMSMSGQSFHPKKQEPFVVNHPAFFFIRENYTKVVLFMGRLAQPKTN